MFREWERRTRKWKGRKEERGEERKGRKGESEGKSE